jgi:hypothetical protein
MHAQHIWRNLSIFNLMMSIHLPCSNLAPISPCPHLVLTSSTPSPFLVPTLSLPGLCQIFTWYLCVPDVTTWSLWSIHGPYLVLIPSCPLCVPYLICLFNYGPYALPTCYLCIVSTSSWYAWSLYVPFLVHSWYLHGYYLAVDKNLDKKKIDGRGRSALFTMTKQKIIFSKNLKLPLGFKGFLMHMFLKCMLSTHLMWTYQHMLQFLIISICTSSWRIY